MQHAFYGVRWAGELDARQQLDDRPARIDFARTQAELGTAREAVMIVVQSFAARDERKPANVRGGVVEGPIPPGMTETVDRGGQEEDVGDAVQACGKQSPADADDRAERGRPDHRADQSMVEQPSVPPVDLDI